MTRDEALMRLTVAYGHQPAVADFNIVAVNHVLDSLIQSEREACAQACDDISAKYKWPDSVAEKVASQWCADRIRARGQA